MSLATKHIPIMAQEISETLLEPFYEDQAENRKKKIIIDCTLGGGGHTEFLLQKMKEAFGDSSPKIIGFDQDQNAILRCHERLKLWVESGSLEIREGRFSEELGKIENQSVHGLLADLGFSSDQIEDASRGLSFQSEGPLDMRLNPFSDHPTAWDVIISSTEKELADIIFEFGEERLSRRIARSIKYSLQKGWLKNQTTSLAEVVTKSYRSLGLKPKMNPATKTFQALRIFVNEELKELDRLLELIPEKCVPGSKVAILTFHSLEDRRVKKGLKTKLMKPSEQEIDFNPRSRSAKLRVGVL